MRKISFLQCCLCWFQLSPQISTLSTLRERTCSFLFEICTHLFLFKNCRKKTKWSKNSARQLEGRDWPLSDTFPIGLARSPGLRDYVFVCLQRPPASLTVSLSAHFFLLDFFSSFIRSSIKTRGSADALLSERSRRCETRKRQCRPRNPWYTFNEVGFEPSCLDCEQKGSSLTQMYLRLSIIFLGEWQRLIDTSFCVCVRKTSGEIPLEWFTQLNFNLFAVFAASSTVFWVCVQICSFVVVVVESVHVGCWGEEILRSILMWQADSRRSKAGDASLLEIITLSLCICRKISPMQKIPHYLTLLIFRLQSDAKE